MRTEYGFLFFTKEKEGEKTDIWCCRNKRTEGILGEIKWFAPWRQYCYFPVVQAIYSKGCLNDIASFIEELMKDRKG